tara:strand:- start:101 stop:625 length:525 start_codon:yes stop_codon:yes gene_type:complete
VAHLYGSAGHGAFDPHFGEQNVPSIPWICTFISFGRHDPVRGLPYGFVCCFVPGVSSSPSFVSSASSTTKAATASIEGNFAPSSSSSVFGELLSTVASIFVVVVVVVSDAHATPEKGALLFKTQHWTTKKNKSATTRGKSFFEARNETAIIIGVVDLFFVRHFGPFLEKKSRTF